MDASMYLDEGLLAEILKRLPVDVLLRFRCVCKSWKSLISSSSFIRAQYLSSSSSNSVESKPFLLFHTTFQYPTYFAFYNPNNQSDSHHRIAFQTAEFDERRISVIGVIHGVVCLSSLGFPNVSVSGYTILWNPTIRRFVNIPAGNELMCDVGFGFDGSNNIDDFKVIRTVLDVEKPTTLEVFSYREGRSGSRTMDSDHIGPFDLVDRHYSHSCFINGAIHWIIKRRNCSMRTILMFDCECEELKTMELPQQFNQHNLIVVSVRLFDHFGKLSVLVATRTKGEGKHEVAVWVMEAYGIARSWKKTSYNKDITKITPFGIRKLVDGCCHTWMDTDEGFKRSQQPWNGYVFEPSMFLMDNERATPRWPWNLITGYDVSFRVIDE